MSERHNAHIASAIDRVRLIDTDGTAICTNGEVSFVFKLIEQGSEVFRESFKAGVMNKTITVPGRTTSITAYVFDYIQYGDLPDSKTSISTLNEIYSMADEYRII